MKDDFFRNDTPELGFGFMRMPTLPDGTKDEKTAAEMVDVFMKNGFSYFDTAAIYEGSEELLRKVLVDRYPRESFRIASKLPMRGIETLEEGKKAFETSLSKIGVEYLDVYLIHALTGKENKRAEELGVWEYMRELKESGLVRHIGFSFHDNSTALDEVLSRHPETEVVQIQVNYADWEDTQVDSRRNYETAIKYGKPVIVMEPVKGGLLVSKDERITELFEKVDPERSAASWALRFAGSHPGIVTVLSGMSTVEQVYDNVPVFKDFRPITDEEQKIIDRAVKILQSMPQYPCTGCGYCIKHCPKSIDIPMVIRQYNRVLMFAPDDPASSYRLFAKPDHLASDCIACRVCEGHCPQEIGISDIMKLAADLFDKGKK